MAICKLSLPETADVAALNFHALTRRGRTDGNLSQHLPKKDGGTDYQANTTMERSVKQLWQARQ